jgi:hypothetical protein
MNATEWLAAYAERLGTESPSAEEIESVLALAGVAAHSSERIAAPVACWMAARAGVSLQDAKTAAQGIGADG